MKNCTVFKKNLVISFLLLWNTVLSAFLLGQEEEAIVWRHGFDIEFDVQEFDNLVRFFDMDHLESTLRSERVGYRPAFPDAETEFDLAVSSDTIRDYLDNDEALKALFENRDPLTGKPFMGPTIALPDEPENRSRAADSRIFLAEQDIQEQMFRELKQRWNDEKIVPLHFKKRLIRLSLLNHNQQARIIARIPRGSKNILTEPQGDYYNREDRSQRALHYTNEYLRLNSSAPDWMNGLQFSLDDDAFLNESAAGKPVVIDRNIEVQYALTVSSESPKGVDSLATTNRRT